MGRGEWSSALVYSTNAINLDFPYQGEQRAMLQLQSDPESKGKGRRSVNVNVQRGQFWCVDYDGCKVAVKFDNGAVLTFTGRTGDNGEPNVLFLYPYEKFISKLRKAKHVSLEVKIYQQGTHVLMFDVEGLEGW